MIRMYEEQRWLFRGEAVQLTAGSNATKAMICVFQDALNYHTIREERKVWSLRMAFGIAKWYQCFFIINVKLGSN